MGLDPLKVRRTKAALVLASYPESRFADTGPLASLFAVQELARFFVTLPTSHADMRR